MRPHPLHARPVLLHLVLALPLVVLAGCERATGDPPRGDLPASEATPPAGTHEATPEAGLTARLREDVPSELAARAEALLDGSEDEGGVARLLALEAYLNRHLETAAWLYARSVEADPDDGLTWSNLGLTLTALAMREDDVAGRTASLAGSVMIHASVSVRPQVAAPLLEEALTALREAVRLAPERPEPHNNLGVALLESGRLDEAERSFDRALELDGDPSGQAIYLAHLAEVYAAQGRELEAAAALARAHALDPFSGPAVLLGLRGASGGFPVPAEADRSYCDAVDFDCMNTCPGGIIGRVNAVTCEMENASNQMACRAGEPYVQGYDCDIEMSNVPFILPGMFPGASIVTPWGRLDVMVQGGGRIDYKVQIGVPGMSGPRGGLQIEAAGSYDPERGGSITRISPSVSINTYDRGSVAPQLNELGVGPSAIKIQGDVYNTDGPPDAAVTINAYDAPLATIH